ncbi:MAG: hypothetical protein ACE5HI_19040, partial [bacterium]
RAGRRPRTGRHTGKRRLISVQLVSQRLITMTTEKCYNMGLKAPASLTSSLVNLLKYAQRASKNTSFRRRFQPDPLWRNGSFSAILPKTGFETISAELYPLAKTQQSISSGPADHDYNLCDGGRYEAYFGYQDFALQRILPGSFGFAKFSRHFDSEEFPEESDVQRNRKPRSAARSPARRYPEGKGNAHRPIFDKETSIKCRLLKNSYTHRLSRLYD